MGHGRGRFGQFLIKISCSSVLEFVAVMVPFSCVRIKKNCLS